MLFFFFFMGRKNEIYWFVFSFFFKFYFIFKLYSIVLVLPNIEMNPPQVYPCSPSWTLLPSPSPYPPSGPSQCTSPKHPASCIDPGLATCLIHDITHVYMEFRKMVTITLCTRQQKRHWCIDQSCGLCGRGRGSGDLGEWHWNKMLFLSGVRQLHLSEKQLVFRSSA